MGTIGLSMDTLYKIKNKRVYWQLYCSDSILINGVNKILDMLQSTTNAESS